MFYFVVDLNGIDTESFQYDTLDEAIAGAHRLALSSLKAWEDDGIERAVTIHAFPIEEDADGTTNNDRT